MMNNLSDLSQFKPSGNGISIFAPISIGNISVGFDSLGMAILPISDSPILVSQVPVSQIPAPSTSQADRNINDDNKHKRNDKLIGDIVHIKLSEKKYDSLSQQGRYKHVLPENFKDNIVWQALLNFNLAFVARGGTSVNVDLILEKNIPICSGMGSSSCSIVAALVALNEFYSKPFSNDELLLMMGVLECVITGSTHYDNLAPCFLGGLQLMLSEDISKNCQSLPIFKDCFWIIAYPDIKVSTRKAREILPKTYLMKTLVKSCQNIAGFIDACHRQDKHQAFSLLTDQIAEPYRESLLANFRETKEMLLTNGCLSVGISGSGPTMFAVADSIEFAEKAKQIMCAQYATSVNSIVEICKVDLVGARAV